MEMVDSAARNVYADGTYLSHNPTWHEETSAWKANEVVKLLYRNRISPSRIAEVGCGAGGVLQAVGAAFPSALAIGYDISPQAIAMCRSKERPRLEYRLEDILQTDCRSDVLLAIDVFEHIEDYIGFLRRLKAHTQYGIFHIPLDLSVQTVARGAPLRIVRQCVGHLHYFTKETALASLEHAGWRVVDWHYTRGAIEAPGRSAVMRFLSLPRRLALALNEDLAVRWLGGCSLCVLCQ